MNITEILLGIIGLLGAGYLYQRNARRKAEAQTLNKDANEADAKLQGQQTAVDAQLQANKAKEAALKPDIGKDAIIDFWNKGNK